MPLPNPPDGTGTAAQRLAAIEAYVIGIGRLVLANAKRDRRINAQGHDPACASLKIALADRDAAYKGQVVPTAPCDCWLSKQPEAE